MLMLVNVLDFILNNNLSFAAFTTKLFSFQGIWFYENFLAVGGHGDFDCFTRHTFGKILNRFFALTKKSSLQFFSPFYSTLRNYCVIMKHFLLRV